MLGRRPSRRTVKSNLRNGGQSQVFEILNAYLAAYRLRPTRAEALWQLASYYREREKFAEGYLFAKVGKDIPQPEDKLLVQHEIYQWRLRDEFSVCAYWLGFYRESFDAAQQILNEPFCPATERDRVQANLAWAQEKLAHS